LTEETNHIIDETALEKCKKGVVILNTSRGGLVDAEALLMGIKSRKVGAACLDVYEEESDIFFEDNSGHIMEDDTLARLISMPNVIVTSHQAFLTEEALENIAETTVNNLVSLFKTGKCENELCYRGEDTRDCKSGKCF
jgi:D-lactate dehydrogenase